MGKVKRQARKHSNHHDNSASEKSQVTRRQHSQQVRTKASKHVVSKGKQNGQSQARLKVPFARHDNVLLVGEGKVMICCTSPSITAVHCFQRLLLTRL